MSLFKLTAAREAALKCSFPGAEFRNMSCILSRTHTVSSPVVSYKVISSIKQIEANTTNTLNLSYTVKRNTTRRVLMRPLL
jgi:hypothetical protein